MLTCCRLPVVAYLLSLTCCPLSLTTRHLVSRNKSRSYNIPYNLFLENMDS